jgi:ubiquinone/menaquinone biosynthesis C-methylase UbiE
MDILVKMETLYVIKPNDSVVPATKNNIFQVPDISIRVKGTAENTGLPDDSVDFVIAAQAFHWFDRERARAEFERILKNKGYLALMWNQRQLDTTAFLVEYEKFLLKYAKDYTHVRHEKIDEEVLAAFFAKHSRKTFDNEQVFDFDGLKGRMLSASYMPRNG